MKFEPIRSLLVKFYMPRHPILTVDSYNCLKKRERKEKNTPMQKRQQKKLSEMTEEKMWFGGVCVPIVGGCSGIGCEKREHLSYSKSGGDKFDDFGLHRSSSSLETEQELVDIIPKGNQE